MLRLGKKLSGAPGQYTGDIDANRPEHRVSDAAITKKGMPEKQESACWDNCRLLLFLPFSETSSIITMRP